MKLMKRLTRLDDIQKSGSEGCLQVLDLVKDLTGEVLLQQRLAVGGLLELLESSFQFLGYGSVNHFDTRRNSKRNLQFNSKKSITNSSTVVLIFQPFAFHSSRRNFQYLNRNLFLQGVSSEKGLRVQNDNPPAGIILSTTHKRKAPRWAEKGTEPHLAK